MTDSIRVPLGDLRALDDKHFPTTRAKRPDWEVCEHDSMTWPCDTEKALRAFADYYEQAKRALDAATARALAAEEALVELRKAAEAIMAFLPVRNEAAGAKGPFVDAAMDLRLAANRTASGDEG